MKVTLYDTIHKQIILEKNLFFYLRFFPLRFLPAFAFRICGLMCIQQKGNGTGFLSRGDFSRIYSELHYALHYRRYPVFPLPFSWPPWYLFICMSAFDAISLIYSGKRTFVLRRFKWKKKGTSALRNGYRRITQYRFADACKNYLDDIFWYI